MHRILALLCTALLLTACGSTEEKVTKSCAANTPLPYPSQILVYDFAISPSEVSPDSAANAQLRGAGDDPQRNAQREYLERQIAAIVSEDIANNLRKLGLPATRWLGAPPAGTDIYAIEGQFLTIDEGSATARMIIGFGAGATEVKTLVQAYYISGGRKSVLGEAEVSAESSKKPGLAAMVPIGAAATSLATAAAIQTGIGVVTEINTDVRKAAEDTAEAIVDALKPRMEEEKWID
jgi:uncharacterized protein DUF4410